MRIAVVVTLLMSIQPGAAVKRSDQGAGVRWKRFQRRGIDHG
jgi:hypothetical protein